MPVRVQEKAFLADFESVRAQPGRLCSVSRRADQSAAGVATARYVAPELRANLSDKPTAATDMYAYGVCALLTCCESTGYAFGPDGQLLQWSCAAATASGGSHLPTLLDGLLDLDQTPAASTAEALVRRMSAAEVLLHPFLDTEAERQSARAARESAAAVQQEAEQQRREVLAENERLQRQQRWEAAERQRLLNEQEQAVKETEAAVAREKHLLAAANAALDQSKAKAEQQVRDATDLAMAINAQKCKAEAELVKVSQRLQAENTTLSQLKADEAKRRATATEQALWIEMAGPCATEQALKDFFWRRQQGNPAGGAVLQIASLVKVENGEGCAHFAREDRSMPSP